VSTQYKTCHFRDKSIQTINCPGINNQMHTTQRNTQKQGSHFPDNVKFPDSSQHSSAALGMLSATHIMPILVLNTCMDTNMQFTTVLGNFSLIRFFP